MLVFAHATLTDPPSAGAVVISAVLTYLLAVVVPGLFLVLIGRSAINLDPPRRR